MNKKARQEQLIVINNCRTLLDKIVYSKSSNIEVYMAKYLEEKLKKKTVSISDLFEDLRFIYFYSKRYDLLNNQQNKYVKYFLTYYQEFFKKNNSLWRTLKDVDEFYERKLKIPKEDRETV
jgi:hypothetical protein